VSSIHAIDPPPVPMDVRSTTDVASGYMPIIGRRAYCSRPSATSPTSKLVPPTSVATTFR
jgi:hypothetical protein